jgi:hypothetical protein
LSVIYESVLARLSWLSAIERVSAFVRPSLILVPGSGANVRRAYGGMGGETRTFGVPIGRSSAYRLSARDTFRL